MITVEVETEKFLLLRAQGLTNAPPLMWQRLAPAVHGEGSRSGERVQPFGSLFRAEENRQTAIPYGRVCLSVALECQIDWLADWPVLLLAENFHKGAVECAGRRINRSAAIRTCVRRADYFTTGRTYAPCRIGLHQRQGLSEQPRSACLQTSTYHLGLCNRQPRANLRALDYSQKSRRY